MLINQKPSLTVFSCSFSMTQSLAYILHISSVSNQCLYLSFKSHEILMYTCLASFKLCSNIISVTFPGLGNKMLKFQLVFAGFAWQCKLCWFTRDGYNQMRTDWLKQWIVFHLLYTFLFLNLWIYLMHKYRSQCNTSQSILKLEQVVHQLLGE